MHWTDVTWICPHGWVAWCSQWWAPSLRPRLESVLLQTAPVPRLREQLALDLVSRTVPPRHPCHETFHRLALALTPASGMESDARYGLDQWLARDFPQLNLWSADVQAILRWILQLEDKTQLV